jgi:hypothetical chaperone protein
MENIGAVNSDVDSVFLTGGTSYVPRIRKIFVDRFGSEKVKSSDVFLNVAEGLGLSASTLF